MVDKPKHVIRRRKRDAGPETPQVAIVVRRGAVRRFERLKQQAAALPVTVSWDRREAERRAAAEPSPDNRRNADRRQSSSFTWELSDFLVLPERPAPAAPVPKPASATRRSPVATESKKRR